MNLLMSPGMWKFGFSGLQGLDWAALWPAVAGHPAFDRVAELARVAERMVVRAMSKAGDKQADRWAQAKRVDPASAKIEAYDLIDPATEVFA